MTDTQKTPQPGNRLWTRDFTIITLGSVVSMLGNSMSFFAMNLMVLDYTGSTLLYAVYMVAYTAPQLIVPIFSGAILDRFSRRKMIYTLDFIIAGLYIVVAGLLSTGWFSFPLFALFCFVTGSIWSIYLVAYESFYPLLITEGNYSKAYSIASVLETMAAVMVPVSTCLYNMVGIAPLLFANGCCFFVAAVMETQIRAEEKYIEKQKKAAEEEGLGLSGPRRMLRDVKEGFQYLYNEKGLRAIAVYFTFSALVGGVSAVVTLPYFRSTFDNGEYVFMLVHAMSYVGRALGGAIHYRWKLPSRYKFVTALAVYVIIGVAEGIYLFFPIPVMMLCLFIMGLGGVTSYTIRISATQNYVPDEKKGRFSGAFQMLNTLGWLVGEMAAGVLAEAFPKRGILLAAELIGVAAALLVIGGRRKHVEPIYNRQV
ncbi:MAG: MFS transporter [Lachnospiraceae bacterium]|nr:MFS transporter [Lachnospiraceae bacterium]